MRDALTLAEGSLEWQVAMCKELASVKPEVEAKVLVVALGAVLARYEAGVRLGFAANFARDAVRVAAEGDVLLGMVASEADASSAISGD